MTDPGGAPPPVADARGRVAAAFAAQPRARFLPASVRSSAGLDQPLPIGFGQTNSQPSTVRDMLVLLDAQPGMRVLEVGAGTGWVLAMLAEMVGPDGAVLGTERVAPLVDDGVTRLADAGVPWARLVLARDDAIGLPDEAPFDRILVSAMARRMPVDLVAQLAPGGVMVAPVNGVMRRVTRGLPPDDGVASATVTDHGPYRFVPLIVP